MWFLEGGSEVVQGGSYILHLPPIRKSVQTVGGFLANQGGWEHAHSKRQFTSACRCARWVMCLVGVASRRFELARRSAREEFPKNLAHNVEKEHLQNSVLEGT